MTQSNETGNWKLETRNSKSETRGSLTRRGRRNWFICPTGGAKATESQASNFHFPVSSFQLRTAFCLLLTAFCLPLAPACGYHVAGQATRIPPDVKTIAVPAFKNQSATVRIEQQVTAAVTREFLERTHYRVLANPADADAVLTGAIKSIRTRAVTFDINTGRATTLEIQVATDVKLEDIHSHKVLFSNSNYVFYEEYQVSESPSALFEEDRPALQRISHDLARSLVTDILENF